MKNIVALVALLVVAVVSGLAVADDTTYVTNASSQGLNAIISCLGCSNPFPTYAVHIAQGQSQDDSYRVPYYNTGTVHIEVWLDGAGQHNQVEVPFDASIVAYDNPNGGVDIYQAAYGTLRDAQLPVLVTIYVD